MHLTINAHVTNPIRCQRKHQVQDVTITKKRGFSNPMTQARRNKSINKCLGSRLKATLERMSITHINWRQVKTPIKITSLPTEKFKINWDRWLLSSLKFEAGRYTIGTKKPNLTNLIQTTFWRVNHHKHKLNISPNIYT